MEYNHRNVSFHFENIYHLPSTNRVTLDHSVRRTLSLNCLHRRRSLAILGHAGPKWRMTLSLHLVLGLPCRLVHCRGVHSVTLLVHLLSLNRAMCPAHPCIPFLITMMSFTPVWCRIIIIIKLYIDILMTCRLE